MKRLIALLIFLSVGLHSFRVAADNPIFWQRYTADPSALVWEGRLYLFCSHDTYTVEGGYNYYMNDVTCISTTDMKNWTDHGEVFSYKDSHWGAKLTWAPQVLEREGKFYLYYGNGVMETGVAVADNPLGPYKDERTTPLVGQDTPGVRLFDAQGNVLIADPDVPGALEGAQMWGVWAFDPCAFIDPKTGKAYLYFGGGHPANSRIIRLKDNLVEVDGNAIHPNTPGFFEASWIHEHDGKYYLSYSGHGFGVPTSIEYVMSDNPMYGFQNYGVILPNPPDNDDNNSHHSIVEYKGKSYIAYHSRKVVHEQMKAAEEGVEWCKRIDGLNDHNAHQYMRSVCIDELNYQADGTIAITDPTEDGVKQIEYVDPFTRQEAEMMAKGWGIAVDDEGTGRVVISQHEGDYIRVRGINFGSANRGTSVKRIQASVKGRGKVEVHLDRVEGEKIATLSASGKDWHTVSASCKPVEGIHDLYFVFPSAGSGIDWWEMSK